jgi:hypothetical protein
LLTYCKLGDHLKDTLQDYLACGEHSNRPFWTQRIKLEASNEENLENGNCRMQKEEFTRQGGSAFNKQSFLCSTYVFVNRSLARNQVLSNNSCTKDPRMFSSTDKQKPCYHSENSIHSGWSPEKNERRRHLRTLASSRLVHSCHMMVSLLRILFSIL